MEKEKDEPPDDGEAASFMDIHDLMRESANLGASNQPEIDKHNDPVAHRQDSDNHESIKDVPDVQESTTKAEII